MWLIHTYLYLCVCVLAHIHVHTLEIYTYIYNYTYYHTLILLHYFLKSLQVVIQVGREGQGGVAKYIRVVKPDDHGLDAHGLILKWGKVLKRDFDLRNSRLLCGDPGDYTQWQDHVIRSMRNVSVCATIYTHMHRCIHMCIFVHTYIHRYLYTYIYIYTHSHTYLYIYIYIYA